MLKETIIYSILTTIVLIVAYIFDVLLEMSLFIIYYYFVKNLFNKQFHADIITKSPTSALVLCFALTFATQIITIFVLSSFELSFFINIYICLLISAISFLLEFWLESFLITGSILKDKEKLIEACNRAKITKEATNRLLLKYIEGLKVKEIAELEKVEEATVWQSIRRSRRKLNIKSDD